MGDIRDVVWAEDAGIGIAHLPEIQRRDLICALTVRLWDGVPRDAERYDDGSFLLEYTTRHLECIVRGELDGDVVLIRAVSLASRARADRAGLYVRGMRWYRRATRRLTTAIAAARVAWLEEGAQTPPQSASGHDLPSPHYKPDGGDRT